LKVTIEPNHGRIAVPGKIEAPIGEQLTLSIHHGNGDGA